MIFLDTANLNEIEYFMRMGVISGVTTNPTILLAEKVENFETRIKEIADMIYPFPLSVETIGIFKEEIIEDALKFSSWKDNIVVKVPIHGPNGELNSVEAIHELEKVYDVRVNATAMMSAQQCYLAALAGATYVSLFGGRVNNMGYDAKIEITKLRKLLDFELLESKIIVGSIREVLNIIEWIEAGADIVTVIPSLLEKMFIHPYTKETVKTFLSDNYRL